MKLKVETLGKFQISDGNTVVNYSNIHSNMLSKLLLYLLVHREKNLSIEDISNAIWEDDSSQNPANALKNLMYRLRKFLMQSFDRNDFIITNRGSYRWNPDIKVVIDAEVFDKLAQSAKNEHVIDVAIDKFEKALSCYKGKYLSQLLDLHWVNNTSTYYHNLYISSVKVLCELYVKMDKYFELDELCSQAMKYETCDEQLYCYQIEAKMKQGQISLALASYDRARGIIEKELGVRKTYILNKVYDELLLSSKGSITYNVKEVKKEIDEDNPSGVFVCGYPVFKEIYRLEARKNERNKVPMQLFLLTIENKRTAKTQNANEKQIIEEQKNAINTAMDQILEVMKVSLRVGDVVARYSDSQYIILLPTCTKELALSVANRIVAASYDVCKSDVVLSFGVVDVDEVEQRKIIE